MAEHRLSILHISDLHARSVDVGELPEKARDKRRREVEREARSRAKVLGKEWDGNLRELFPDAPPDLVCFTGDVADWGLRAEYRELQAFVERIERVLGVARDRIYVVPGNHDVQRYVSKREWRRLRTLLADQPRAVSDWLAGGDPPKGVSDKAADAVLKRCAAFWEWVEHGLRRPDLLPTRHAHRRLGYCHQPDLGLPFPVHVIGLDSAWMAGDDHDHVPRGSDARFT